MQAIKDAEAAQNISVVNGESPSKDASRDSTLAKTHEGSLLRKQEQIDGKKSSNRSWNEVFCVLQDKQLHFYKDTKSATNRQSFHGEGAISLDDISCEVATDYKKRKHVFRLRLQNGTEYLLKAKDENEMNEWISRLPSDLDSSFSSRVSTPSRVSQVIESSSPQVKKSSKDKSKRKGILKGSKKK